MAKTIEQLEALAQQIKNETVSKQNTATRVGGMLEDTIDKIQEVINNLTSVANKEGNLSNLTTTEKTNLVSAINELVTALNNRYTKSEVNAITGALNDLTTSVKTSVVAAVNEVNEKVGSICNESTTSQAEEIVISNDSESEDYIKMGSYGIKAKEYLDLDGNQISGYNLLKSKKWAVIGDSFSTNADSPVSSDSYIVGGKYNGKLKDYGYIIGNRNHMDLTILHRAGKTMALPADGTFQNSICSETDSQSYLNIPSDVDYITIQLGINDAHHLTGDASQDGEDITGAITLGTIDSTDISTFYGAWNYICEWILTNRPFAHYGIIITNGIPSTNKDFYDAEIEIAEKWGIPYLDLNGDERCPAMHRATNSKMCQKAKDLRLSNFTEGATGTHPNYKAHEYESTFIENFLRSI